MLAYGLLTMNLGNTETKTTAFDTELNYLACVYKTNETHLKIKDYLMNIQIKR